MEDDMRKSHEAGFKHHLVKPIDLNKLDLLIQEAGDGEHANVAPGGITLTAIPADLRCGHG